MLTKGYAKKIVSKHILFKRHQILTIHNTFLYFRPMAAVGYYIALPFIYLISMMPFWMLYGFSNFIYFLIYHVIGYRKKVVYQNLKNSFPEKSEKELIAIQKKFYRFFCDLILETLKMLTMSRKTVLKRFKVHGAEFAKKIYEANQSVITVMGHYGNWELCGSACALLGYHQLHIIYHPLSNKYFEKLVLKMRTRMGNKMVPMKDTLRRMIQNKSEVTATIFVADQTPSAKGAYWTTFLHQDTAVFPGTAKLAKKFKYPIIYVKITRPRRGYYNIYPELLIDNPEKYTEDEISELHTRRLEKDIIETPELWLWSHRRWKHKRPQEKKD